jgi:hypothetical protein
MPRTDDLRIREMKELTPPSHLIREFACGEAAEQTAASGRVALHRILHGQPQRFAFHARAVLQIKSQAGHRRGARLPCRNEDPAKVLQVIHAHFQPVADD